MSNEMWQRAIYLTCGQALGVFLSMSLYFFARESGLTKRAADGLRRLYSWARGAIRRR